MIYRIYRQMSATLEHGFHIESTQPLTDQEFIKVTWLIAETFEPQNTSIISRFSARNIVEIGPRLSIESPYSSNAVAIFHSIGLKHITRVERTSRHVAPKGDHAAILSTHLDRMTEQHYPHGIDCFDTGIKPEPVRVIDLLGRGKPALVEINKELGLGMDARDLDYYVELFVNILKRNPTDVELFQLGNANSEHSRHWYFRGKIVIDGIPMERTLFEIVQQPLKSLGRNITLVAFKDNAGVLEGFGTRLLLPGIPGQPSWMRICNMVVHITATAETHNHPTYVSPFAGAQTGAGGRDRDTCAVGRGGFLGVGAAGYFVGNLFLTGHEIPGEIVGSGKPSKYASSLRILIDASRGIATHGNEIGEGLTFGFCRSFEQMVNGEWFGSRKPILWSGGIGHLFGGHVKKAAPEIGMLIVRIGGPAYPIGVGGGSASSVIGTNTESLDFASVQRANPEMGNRATRVIRTCVEMGENNPIELIHDQGAGGPSNVLTELLEPLGGTLNIRDIFLGDKTMSLREIWSAEFQEGYGLLIQPANIDLFRSVCVRERVNCEVLGSINGSGNVVVFDSTDNTTPVNLNLEQVLTNMPQKEFESTRKPRALTPLKLPRVSIADAIKAVFRQLSVCSKGNLTRQVDRSVTGLIVRQQCCGIEQIPIADCSVNAQSYFGLTGSAAAIGEQPIKMLINPAAGARMSVGEMLTNLAGAAIEHIGHIRCRANWMGPAKLPHEGPHLYDAAVAMSDLMVQLGIAIDGGKDSLSMAVPIDGELVKTPLSLVILGYAPVPDITKVLTPDVKRPGHSKLGFINLAQGKNRLGGSALAQSFNQLGDECPDVDQSSLLKDAFLAVQEMIDKGVLLALHDRSDGGLITSVAEMCMASRAGFDLFIPGYNEPLPALFSEELGFVIELNSEDEHKVRKICKSYDVPFQMIGKTRDDGVCNIFTTDAELLWSDTIQTLRGWWEATSTAIEKLQMNPACAEEESRGHTLVLPSMIASPTNRLSFTPKKTPSAWLTATHKPRVMILREEGTNGEREMHAAFVAAGFDTMEVCMADLLAGTASLDQVQGVVFAGGFSYMDTFGAAKGWAGTIRFNDRLREMFARFKARPDTFSLGVCNGCQLMALLGWVPWEGIEMQSQPRFVGNTSGRFESRWVQVEVLPSPAMMLADMVGTKLGVWAAHGEGRLVYPDPAIAEKVREQKLAPLAFIGPDGQITEEYPYNPNGSPGGTTALCSPCGRHLAFMEHPERSFLLWQLPWVPPQWRNLTAAPWLRMFQNARQWCMDHRA